MSHEKPLISVIIPVYNTEAYLERCLVSVLSNTYRDLEVICINDGSTDGSLEILNAFARQDERVTVIDKKNGGLSAARNDGLRRATGEWIAFIDSDDWIHPRYFETFLSVAPDRSVDIVIGDMFRTNRMEPFPPIHKEKLQIRYMKFAEIYADHDLKSYCWGRIYKASILADRRFSEDIFCVEDRVFNASILLDHKDAIVAHIPVVLYYYFNRPGSLVHVFNGGKMQIDSRALADYAFSNPDSEIKSILLTESMKLTLAARYLSIYDPEKKDVIKSCNALLKRCISELSSIKDVSSKEKLKYRILYAFPELYRAWRIRNDRTLLAWEKAQREQFITKRS